MLYALKYLLRYIGVCQVKIILTPEKIFKGYGVRSTLLTDDIHKKVGHSSLEMKMGRTGDGGIGRQKR